MPLEYLYWGEGDQYEDGNGNDFTEQQVKKGMPGANQYSNPNQKAYEKKTLLTKGQFNINDDQELKLSYTGNRSDNILYPAGSMDADYDDSNIYTVGYTARNLGNLSKELNLLGKLKFYSLEDCDGYFKRETFSN
jgi:iron complex outermembrane receptor protein